MGKRLVLFVEGGGDVDAVPLLVGKILTQHSLWGSLFLDDKPFRIGGLSAISGAKQDAWTRLLKRALLRSEVGAILTLLDGDSKEFEGSPFCPASAAATLADRAKLVGAGTVFSLGFVFACQEYESWLLAGVESLAGKQLPDGRAGVKAGTTRFSGNLEVSPRNAKGALGDVMARPYKESIDQAELTKLVDLDQIRQCGLRSFCRLERALQQLAGACNTGSHVATPPSS